MAYDGNIIGVGINCYVPIHATSSYELHVGNYSTGATYGFGSTTGTGTGSVSHGVTIGGTTNSTTGWGTISATPGAFFPVAFSAGDWIGMYVVGGLGPVFPPADIIIEGTVYLHTVP